MSGSVFTLNPIIFLLLCFGNTTRAEQSVCPTSCCECILGGQEIQCDGNKLFPEFICEVRQVLDKLYLDHMDKPKLRDNLDKVNEIQYLIIRNSPIRILTDIIDGKKSLKRLKLINISLANDWKWGPVFSQLNNLMDFQLKETKLSSDQLVISGSEDQMTNNNMISFSVNKCNIQSIESNITKKWIHLKMISLAHNCIQELDRDWLPHKLERLWSLDLSYNNISWIPEDFFGGMTALRKLRLDNNGFTTLHEMWFRHIWEGLHELWIDHNQIECDPNLSWIPNATHPTFFDGGTCITHFTNKYGQREKKVRYFYELRNSDNDIDVKH